MAPRLQNQVSRDPEKETQEASESMRNQKYWMALGLMTLSAIATGCGSSAYPERVSNTGGSQTGGSGGTGGGVNPGSGGNGSTGGSGSPSGGGIQYATANYTRDFVITGSGTYTSPAINTFDSKFIVKFRAGSPQPLSGTGYTIGFNCLRYTVTVLGDSRQVLVKRAGYVPFSANDPCAGAEDVATIDYSGRLSSGTHSINIKISNMQYDNCRKYNYPQSGGCPIEGLYNNGTPHSAQGRFEATYNQVQ